MVKVSVILSIYNHERGLNPSLCIESILTQTFADFELILINNGSTDRSGILCDDYAKSNDRISVIHRENQDQGAAYNAGIAQASGSQLVFVEADDFLHEEFLKILYDQQKQNDADISLCDFLPIEEGTAIDPDRRKKPLLDFETIQKTGVVALREIYDTERVFTVSWSKMYRKDLFEKIKFPEGLVDEDEFIAHQLLYEANRIVHIREPLYYYVITVGRKGSITPIPMTIAKFDKMRALYERVLFFKEKQLKGLEERALLHFTEHFFWYYIQSQTELPRAVAKRKEINQLYKRLFFPLLKSSELSRKEKLIFTTFRISPYLYEMVRSRLERKKLQKQL